MLLSTSHRGSSLGWLGFMNQLIWSTPLLDYLHHQLAKLSFDDSCRLLLGQQLSVEFKLELLRLVTLLEPSITLYNANCTGLDLLDLSPNLCVNMFDRMLLTNSTNFLSHIVSNNIMLLLYYRVACLTSYTTQSLAWQMDFMKVPHMHKNDLVYLFTWSFVLYSLPHLVIHMFLVNIFYTGYTVYFVEIRKYVFAVWQHCLPFKQPKL